MKTALRALKNEWNEYCEGERLVRELTSNDDEKPTVDKLMRLVYLIGAEPENYQRTYMMIMKRVTDGRYLRHMEKGLIVVEYILKYGDHRFVRSCKRDIRHIKKLKGYTYELYNKDFGGGVRRRATHITQLLEDDSKLDAARLQAQGQSSIKKPKKMVSSVDITVTKKKDEKDRSEATTENTKITAEKHKSQQKEKEKEKVKEKVKEKETRKPKEQLAPSEDLLSDETLTSFPQTATISSDDWLEDFAIGDKQFANSGVGEDGGKFGFADFDDNDNNDDNNFFSNDEQTTNRTKNQDDFNSSEAWMTQLTQLENPLQTLERPQKKINKKGKTMAQMQSKQDLTGTFDDNFLQTIQAGLTGQPTNQSLPTNGSPLIANNPSPMMTGTGFGYQPNMMYVNNGVNMMPTYPTAVDPFLSLEKSQFNSSMNSGPIPATYQKNEGKDPFSNLNWK